ncbi:MAG: hypothetical protein GC195_16675 [Nostoc sp. RI_552]|nr:hypothetical protein [Nostoc sp. RI_552]
MLVFNIKLRSNKSSPNSCISIADAALLIRNVETRKSRSLQAGQRCMSVRAYSNTMLSSAGESEWGKPNNSRAIKSSTKS